MAFQEVIIFGHTGNVGSQLVKQVVELDGPDHGHANPTRIVGVANQSGYVVSHRGLKHICDQAKSVLETEDFTWEDLTQKDLFTALVRHWEGLSEDDRKRVENDFKFRGYEKDNILSRAKEVIDAVKKEGLCGEVVYVDATSAGTETNSSPNKETESSPEAPPRNAWSSMHVEVIESGDKLVTANKNPLALTDYDTFERLIEDRHRYAFNATALAGGDAVRWLVEARHLSETVTEVSGCFSGALGFIATELRKKDENGRETRRKFSEVVREALDEYTEPDPRDDLSGLDVMRKLIILARSLGCKVDERNFKDDDGKLKESGDFVLQGFVSDLVLFDKNQTSKDEFIEKLEAFDDEIERRVTEAAEADPPCVLRYVATLEVFDIEPDPDNHPKPKSMKIGLELVPEDGPFGRLEGPANLVRIVSNHRAPADCPHEIKTKGAGVERTAAALRADLLGFLTRFTNASTFDDSAPKQES